MPKPSPESQIDWKTIINRISWLIIFLFVFFSFIAAIKILGLSVGTDININAEVFLAFLISIFSVWLSILFYFKTEETSNRFYDNTYKFSSDISNALTEVKSEFGEHLKNLDRGYEKLADAVSTSEILKPLEDARKSLEKPIDSNLNTNDLSKQALAAQLKALRKRIESADKNISKVIDEASSPIRDRVLSFTRRRVVELLGGNSIRSISDQDISKRFKKLVDDTKVPRQYVADLKTVSFIDENNFLSIEFIDHLRRYSHLGRFKSDSET